MNLSINFFKVSGRVGRINNIQTKTFPAYTLYTVSFELNHTSTYDGKISKFFVENSFSSLDRAQNLVKELGNSYYAVIEGELTSTFYQNQTTGRESLFLKLRPFRIHTTNSGNTIILRTSTTLNPNNQNPLHPSHREKAHQVNPSQGSSTRRSGVLIAGVSKESETFKLATDLVRQLNKSGLDIYKVHIKEIAS